MQSSSSEKLIREREEITESKERNIVRCVVVLSLPVSTKGSFGTWLPNDMPFVLNMMHITTIVPKLIE
jgi:hypothetical protein